MTATQVGSFSLYKTTLCEWLPFSYKQGHVKCYGSVWDINWEQQPTIQPSSIMKYTKMAQSVQQHRWARGHLQQEISDNDDQY